MKYRDISHSRPAPGAKLPAFIVSVYENGDVLLYSHGGFDIWCVYLATPNQLRLINHMKRLAKIIHLFSTAWKSSR